MLVTKNVESPSKTDSEEPDFGGGTFGPVGGRAVTGVRLKPLTGANGNGDGGIAGEAGSEVLLLLEQETEGLVVVELGLFTIVFGLASDKTPYTPWHLIEDPAVHMFGLMSFTLLRKKLLLPLLEILSMYSGFELGIMEPVGICCKQSKIIGEGIEWRSKNSEMASCWRVIFDIIRSLGIKKVRFP